MFELFNNFLSYISENRDWVLLKEQHTGASISHSPSLPAQERPASSTSLTLRLLRLPKITLSPELRGWRGNTRFLVLTFLVSLSFFFKINLFIYFWLHWVFVAGRGLSLVAVSGGYSSLWCLGLSLQWFLLWCMGSRHAGFSSCGSRA